MKVLVIDEWFPWPLDCGKKIRSYNLLKRLANNHQIIYIAFSKSQEYNDKVKKMFDWCYRVVPVEDVRKEKWKIPFYIDVILNAFSTKPFTTTYHIKKEYETELIKVINEEKPDLIHCEWSNLAPYLKLCNNVPFVIAAHNVESDIWKRLSLSTKNVFKYIIGKQQAKRVEELERYWYSKAECCTAVSNQDKNTITSYGANVALVENGVDIKYYECDCDYYDVNCVTFTASFDTFSNQDGALYFIKEIYPLIKYKKPNVRLKLIGKNPPDIFIKLCVKDPTIEITGTVQDVRPYLLDSAVCIVPLRIGGGSRLKILEAMAMKKPVVSTSIGAEGLVIEDGKNILLADDPQLFSDMVVSVMKRTPDREKLIKSAYDLVVNKYDWSVLSEYQNSAWQIAVNKNVNPVLKTL